MAQTFTEVKTAFTNMSFTPDVPAAALSGTEYNAGLNVETDTRGIRSVLGDQNILDAITGTPIYVTGGYRANDVWWYIIATNDGRWWRVDENATPVECTPNLTPLTGYSDTTSITEAWSGTTLLINDGLHPPMYLLGDASEFDQYSDDPAIDPVWNYNPQWSALTAGFMRIYNSPNVGSLLIAGNLASTDAISSIVTQYPTTVRWSRVFPALGAVPQSWQPTLNDVANELEVPVRGPVVDGFPCNGNFYVCSYWDTVIFSPLNFTSTTAPVLGVRLLNQGRGLLNQNCWANADSTVYGLDARDIWVFDGNNFKSLGNQRVRNYFFDNLNPLYSDRVFLVNNTRRNQVEIYYPDMDSTGWCNKMLSYRYDLDIFNPPRDVANASHATEGPRYVTLNDSTEAFDKASRTIVYSRGVANTSLVEKDIGTTFLSNTPITSQFRRDNISLGLKYSQQALLHRILPEVINIDQAGIPIEGVGNITVRIGGTNSVGTTVEDQPNGFQTPVVMPIATQNPWTQINQNAHRVVTIELNNISTTDTWQCTAVNWQFVPTEDSR